MQHLRERLVSPMCFCGTFSSHVYRFQEEGKQPSPGDVFWVSFFLLALRVELSLAVSITHLDELVARCFDPVLGSTWCLQSGDTGVPSLRALKFRTSA